MTTLEIVLGVAAFLGVVVPLAISVLGHEDDNLPSVTKLPTGDKPYRPHFVDWNNVVLPTNDGNDDVMDVNNGS